MVEPAKPKTRFQQRNQKNYSNPDLNTKSAVNFNAFPNQIHERHSLPLIFIYINEILNLINTSIAVDYPLFLQ